MTTQDECRAKFRDALDTFIETILHIDAITPDGPTAPFCRDFNAVGASSYQNIAKTGQEPVNRASALKGE